MRKSYKYRNHVNYFAIMQDHETISKNNPNLWFHESICMLASIWVLRKMGDTWEDRPPYPNWVSYRHQLLRYADDMMQRPGVQFSGTATEWLSEWEDFLRGKSNNFTQHLLVLQLSSKFLPIFEENPKAWNAVRQMPASRSKMSEYMKDWYNKVDIEDKQYVEAIAEEMGIEVMPTIPSVVNAAYTHLTFSYNSDNSIIPINKSHEWTGYAQIGTWEKTPDGNISNRSGNDNFSEMDELSHWVYSHAPATIVYDVSDIEPTSFGASFLLPHPYCGGAASMEFTAKADGVKLYSEEFYLADYGSYIEFEIPSNTQIFTIEIGDLGNQGCDHFVLGEPRLYYNQTLITTSDTQLKDNTHNDTGDRSDTLSLLPMSVPSPNIGQQLKLSLKITNGESVAGYQATVQFDDTALRYVESRNSDYLPDGAFFVPPILEGNLVKLNAASVAGESKGNGPLVTLTFEVIAVKASTLTLSDVLLSNSIGETFAPQIENAEITEPTKLKGDVNGDGTVNIADLVLVASNLGQIGANIADVNSDGVVNIADLVLVAGALGTSASAPSLNPQTLEMLN